jgi:hypothetical protein
MSTSTIAVDRLEESCVDSYTAFVTGHPDATFYHSYRYHSFLLDLLACQCDTLVAHCRDEIQGVMPLMSTNGSYGTVFNSLPFYGSYGGVLAANADAARALWMGYRDLLGGTDVCAGTVVANPFCSNLDIYRDAPVGLIDHRLLQYSALEGDADFPDRLLAHIDGSSRRNIRKAERSGVKVIVDEAQMDFLANCHFASMRKIGGKPKPKAFFDSLSRYFYPGRDYRLYVAQIDGETVSALLLFYYENYVEYFIPVTVHEHRDVQPLALVLFQAMCDAAREGYRIWNWGGTWESQTGVYRFKKKWGAAERRYDYLITVVNSEFLEYADQDSLGASYGHFYVVPFGNLNPATKSIS